MNKFDKIVSQYIVYAIPLLFVIFGWGFFDDTEYSIKNLSPAMTVLWYALAWIFIIWTIAGIYLTIKMIFSKKLRDGILKKMAGIQERDEREEYLSGNAAKFSFLSTLSFLLLMLFFSLFSVKIARTPGLDLNQDKKGMLTFSLHPKLIDKEAYQKVTIDSENRTVTEYTEFPVTKAGILIFLILWQVGSYRFKAGRDESFG